MFKYIKASFVSLVVFSTVSMSALAGSVELIIKDHKFQPEVLTVSAGEKVKILVKNHDATPEEFESHSLNREKVIPGNSSAVIFVGPLEPGEYEFVGEFHEDTAKGKIVAK